MRQAVFLLGLQSWLNWYSTGLENRHSERISGFESQALRFAPLAQPVEHLTFNQRVGSSSLLRGSIEIWCNWQHGGLQNRGFRFES